MFTPYTHRSTPSRKLKTRVSHFYRPSQSEIYCSWTDQRHSYAFSIVSKARCGLRTSRGDCGTGKAKSWWTFFLFFSSGFFLVPSQHYIIEVRQIPIRALHAVILVLLLAPAVRSAPSGMCDRLIYGQVAVWSLFYFWPNLCTNRIPRFWWSPFLQTCLGFPQQLLLIIFSLFEKTLFLWTLLMDASQIRRKY